MIEKVISKKIGIIGGGQLGKMMILEAKKLGLYVTILDPVKDCPASSICDEHIIAKFDDKEAISQLIFKSDIITYEFEHIDYKYLLELEKEGYKIYPSPKCLKVISNKFIQKNMLRDNNILVPDFFYINSIEELKKISLSLEYPFMLKSCTGGYDGKGNFTVYSEKDIEDAFYSLKHSEETPLMVEKFVNFKMEVSVLACNGLNKDIKIYPIGNNIHRDSILKKTIVPADLSSDVKDEILNIAHKIINIFNTFGIFCIEFFITEDNKVLVNEIAPRPHNSGHYTIDACRTSQFENHIRSILNLPLGETTLFSPTVMVNILGGDDCKGEYDILGINEALSTPNLSLHLYGKKETSPKRKIGHLTVTSENVDTAGLMAEKALNCIKFISKN